MTFTSGVSCAQDPFLGCEDTLAGAVLDGHLLEVPHGDGWPGALYVDEALAQLLGLRRHRDAAPEVAESQRANQRVASALRVAVAGILEAHPVPEIHQDVPTQVDARGRPSGHVRAAVIRQDDAVWLTTILARNPEPVRPEMARVGAAPMWVGR